MAVKLADETVAAMRPPEGRKDALIFDGTLKGFGVRVTDTGKKLFLFQYNAPGRPGAKRRVQLGAFGEVTAAAARKRAEIYRGQVRDGRDPAGERVVKKAADSEAAASAKVAKAAAFYTVDRLIGDWETQHLAARSLSYRTRAPKDLRIALKGWLSVAAAKMTRQGAVHALAAAKVSSGPVMANRIRAEARACWTWAVRQGALDENPWDKTPRPLARETPRKRVLTDAEIGTLYSAAGALIEPMGSLIRTLILTGQRRGEVAGMRWNELDFDAATWSLPGTRTKNHHEHIVPLAPAVVELLRSVPRRKDAVLVFEGWRHTTLSGFGKVKRRLDAALGNAAKEQGRTVAPWVLHDIRRTVATGLQKLGVRLEVTEAVLNHVSGSRGGIKGVYQVHDWADEKIAALAGWTERVVALAEGREAAGNVVEMRRATA